MIKSARGFITQSYKTFSMKAASPAFMAPTLSYKFSQRQTLQDKLNDHEQKKTVEKIDTEQGPIPDALLQNDHSLNNFMNKIYRTTGFSIAGYLGTSYMLAFTPLMYSPMGCVIGGLVASIGGIVAFNRIPMQITTQKIQGGHTIEKWENPASRKLAFSSIVAGSGLASAPFMAALIATSPGTIPVAACSALMVMGGASAYSMYKPLGSFKTWESALWGGLIGIVGMNLAGLGAGLMFGPNAFTMACHSVSLYAGLGLFTAFQAYDTHTAIQAHQAGSYDHLQHTIDFFLNFVNLFRRLAEIFMRFRD